MQLLDLDDGSMIREFRHGAQVVSLAFSSDGTRLVSAGIDKNVCVFDVASGDELVRIHHAEDLKQVALSPDGRMIASTSADKKLYLWDAKGAALRSLEHPATPWSVAFSPDGRRIISGTGGTLIGKRSDMSVDVSKDNALREWDVARASCCARCRATRTSWPAWPIRPTDG